MYSIIYTTLFLLILYYLCFIWKEPKSTFNFWQEQPLQKKKGIFPNIITKSRPKVYTKIGFDVKELKKWNYNYISDFSSDIYNIMCNDNNAKVFAIITDGKAIGFIYGQKQKVRKSSIEIVYVGGLYLLPEYRNQGLSALLISTLVDAWWDKCNQIIFIHDKPILDNKYKPLQEKEIYAVNTLTQWLYSNASTSIEKQKHIEFSSINNVNDGFLLKKYGLTYHINGYSAYIHKVNKGRKFTKELLRKISEDHPHLIWIYVPKEYSAMKTSTSYIRYIYGYNMRGGKKNENYRIFDI